MHRPSVVFAWCGCLLAAVPTLAAQQRSSIVIVVRSSATLEPLAEAEVRVTLPGGRDTTLVTDASGRHVLRRLAPGSYVVRARWRDIQSHDAVIRLADREEVEVEFTVGAFREPVALPEITVPGDPAAKWLARFEERRAIGIGQFLSRPQIEAQPGQFVEHLLRQFSGIAMRCTNTQGCLPYFSRAPQRLSRPQGEICLPAYYLDESPVEPSVLLGLRRDEIEAIEAYAGMSQVPLDLRPDPRDARCGAIYVWSRRPGIRYPARQP
jgi:hypothetical protein